MSGQQLAQVNHETNFLQSPQICSIYSHYFNPIILTSVNTHANNHIKFNGTLKALLLMSSQCKGRFLPSRKYSALPSARESHLPHLQNPLVAQK